MALNCSAEGRHLPLVSWTTPAPASSGHIDISYSPVNETFATSNLTISATLPTDNGTYYCTGHNSLGNDTQSIFLQVLGTPKSGKALSVFVSVCFLKLYRAPRGDRAGVHSWSRGGGRKDSRAPVHCIRSASSNSVVGGDRSCHVHYHQQLLCQLHFLCSRGVPSGSLSPRSSLLYCQQWSGTSSLFHTQPHCPM